MTAAGIARYLFDADALICLRSLALVERLCSSERFPRPAVITQYVARHELSAIDGQIRELEAAGLVRVESILAKDPDFRRLRQGGVDKGEAEAISWAMAQPPERRPAFISLDRKGRATARENGVSAGDVMDLLVDLIEQSVLTTEEARERVAPWDDRRQQRGRPSDFKTFDEMLDRRRLNRWSG